MSKLQEIIGEVLKTKARAIRDEGRRERAAEIIRRNADATFDGRPTASNMRSKVR